MNPIPWVEGCAYKNEYVKEYEQIMWSVASLNHVHFIPLFDQFLKGSKKLLKDGVHPNNKGHQAIYEIVMGYLRKNNIIDL